MPSRDSGAHYVATRHNYNELFWQSRQRTFHIPCERLKHSYHCSEGFKELIATTSSSQFDYIRMRRTTTLRNCTLTTTPPSASIWRSTSAIQEELRIHTVRCDALASQSRQECLQLMRRHALSPVSEACCATHPGGTIRKSCDRAAHAEYLQLRVAASSGGLL